MTVNGKETPLPAQGGFDTIPGQEGTLDHEEGPIHPDQQGVVDKSTEKAMRKFPQVNYGPHS